jgi:type VI secretion system secreted protein VgrG
MRVPFVATPAIALALIVAAIYVTGAAYAAPSHRPAAKPCASQRTRTARAHCAKVAAQQAKAKAKANARARAAATVPPVPLATAEPFAVLAGAGVTNTGPTTIGGDIGTFPTTTMSGTATLTVNGTDHGGDAVTQQAKQDWGPAYDQAASQGPSSPIVADLGGQTLYPGVYN